MIRARRSAGDCLSVTVAEGHRGGCGRHGKRRRRSL